LSPSKVFPRFNEVFATGVKRVVLENIDGDLIVTEVEFDHSLPSSPSASSYPHPQVARKSSGLGSK